MDELNEPVGIKLVRNLLKKLLFKKKRSVKHKMLLPENQTYDFWQEKYCQFYCIGKEFLGPIIEKEIHRLIDLGADGYLRFSRGLHLVKASRKNKKRIHKIKIAA